MDKLNIEVLEFPNKSWDDFFMELANLYATKSKDQNSKIGCIIVDQNNHVASAGYNGFPWGINDEAKERHERPTKYHYTVHAEANAIAHAAFTGVSLNNCISYTRWLPCCNCAGLLRQAGIVEVVYCEEPEHWAEKFAIAKNIFNESKILIRKPNEQKINKFMYSTERYIVFGCHYCNSKIYVSPLRQSKYICCGECGEVGKVL